MLKWEINKNVISKLYYKGQNIINPWGFETADSSSFFSLEQFVGWRYVIIRENVNSTAFVNRTHVVTKMHEGKWELFAIDKIIAKHILREVTIRTLEDSFFMDFVLRYRFKKEFIKYVIIDDKKIYHKNTNIYHQFLADSIFLKGSEFDIKLSILGSIVPDKMQPMIYARDYLNEWVIHVRMFPKEWDKEVIKICTNWAGTRPLPLVVSRNLLKNRWLREQLWYRAEKNPYRSRFIRRFINPSAFGMVKVEKGTDLMWKVKLEFL